MKDYYTILEVSEKASQTEIRSAFRRLAFKHHPDTNPGNERQAEGHFKEINEAYGVLGDETRRREYDRARQSPFAGTRFAYSQQDIFRDIFTSQAATGDLLRMFRQAGLRFDQDFLNRVFFAGGGLGFDMFTGPTARRREADAAGQASSGDEARAGQPVRPPGFISRLLVGAAVRFLGFLARQALGQAARRRASLDRHVDLEVTAAEAEAGGERPITYKRGSESKRLVVKIPAGVSSGTEIRLRGMGSQGNGIAGDLYLRVRVSRE